MIGEVPSQKIEQSFKVPHRQNSLPHNRELSLSFLAIFLVTGLYTVVVIWLGSIPKASDFFGHSLGVIGFTMMVMTETLYTFRKRARSARWGRMSTWLQFHIFTGIVGPYLVLLHTSWKFNGLAGVLMLLTAVTVLSGFVGRYIYTALPRSTAGIDAEAQDLEHQAAILEHKVFQVLDQRWQSYPLPPAHLFNPSSTMRPIRLIFGRAIDDLLYRVQWTHYKSRLPSEARVIAQRLQRLVDQRRQIQRELSTATVARRIMALWHTIHIPIGMALFALAAVHIVAAIYYATLLR